MKKNLFEGEDEPDNNKAEMDELIQINQNMNEKVKALQSQL